MRLKEDSWQKKKKVKEQQKKRIRSTREYIFKNLIIKKK